MNLGVTQVVNVAVMEEYMEAISLSDQFLRCSFLVKVGALKLEPSLFCKLEKQFVYSSDQEIIACSNLRAVPYSLQKVRVNLEELVKTNKISHDQFLFLFSRIADIQKSIVMSYRFNGQCYNCHLGAS